MSDTPKVNPTAPTPPPPKRRRWLKVLIGIVAIFVVLVVAVYFVGTSSGFLKSVILPKVGKSINATITVSDASISPFKQVILHDLKVQTTGDEPLLTAPEVRLRYSLMDIIKGNIHVDEAVVTSPTISLVENADATSNLDPILKSQNEAPKKEASSTKSGQASQPPHLDVKKVALTGATIRRTKIYDASHRDVTEISNVNVTVDDLKNGQTGKLALSADLKMETHPPAPGTNGMLQATVKGAFDFSLSADAKPLNIKGNTHLGLTQATGSFSEVASLAGDLDCEVTPTEVKQVSLRFQKGGTRLGELRVNGPFDMEKTEGRLTVQILAIDKQVLNLAGAASGIDFGPTTINSTNDIQLTKGGSVLTAVGRFDLSKLQLTRTNQTTPQLDIAAQYNVTVDRGASNALLREFTLTGSQTSNPLLRGDLTSPMNLAWGSASPAVGDSELNLTVTNLNLADWKPFLGDSPPGGNLGLRLKLVSQQSGKLLTYDVNSQIDNFSASAGSNQITQARVTLHVNGKATDLKQFNLTEYKLELVQQNQPLMTASGSGTYDKAAETADIQLTLQATLERLLQVVPQPGMSVSSGTIELKSHVTQKQKAQAITGSFVLANFTGRSGSNEFRNFGATADLDINKNGDVIEIKKVAGKVTEGGNAGGNFEITGTYAGTNKPTQLNAKAINFNEVGLRPFLEPALGDKKLVSIALNFDTAIQYTPEADSSIKGSLQVTNLVVNDPENKVPATPLEARIQMDVSLRKKVADIRQFQIGLTPTERATNQIVITGHVDTTTSNTTGTVKLASDGLDLTRYYDLFAGDEKAKAKPPATASVKKPSSKTTTATSVSVTSSDDTNTTKELPFRNFTAEASIRRLYLREVDIADFQTTAKVDGGHVVVNPLKLSLNGAPVTSTVDLDMAVPGFKYDLVFNAQAIPLAPLVNSFSPERKGQLGGTLTAQAKIGGTGTSGASLQKTLTGQFDVASTNLNLSVVNIRNRLLKSLIDVIAVIPELAKNPAAAVGAAFGKGGLSDELAKSPINSVGVRGTAGSGKVEVGEAVVTSAAFRADAKGTVTLAEILTNSPINIPVSVSLSKGVADKLSLVPANTPTNAAYAKLPDFVTMKGTVGDPKTDINKVALAGTAFRTIGGIVSGLGGGKSGGLIKSAGDLLTGNHAGTNAPPEAGTNQPSTNAAPAAQSPVGDLLNQFLKPKPKKK